MNLRGHLDHGKQLGHVLVLLSPAPGHVVVHVGAAANAPQYSGRNLWMVPLAHGASYSVNSLVTVINYLPSTEIAKNGLQWVILESLLGNKFPV